MKKELRTLRVIENGQEVTLYFYGDYRIDEITAAAIERQYNDVMAIINVVALRTAAIAGICGFIGGFLVCLLFS